MSEIEAQNGVQAQDKNKKKPAEEIEEEKNGEENKTEGLQEEAVNLESEEIRKYPENIFKNFDCL